MVDLMYPDAQEYCAKYVCELELDDFLLLGNSELTDFNGYFFYHESTLLTP